MRSRSGRSTRCAAASRALCARTHSWRSSRHSPSQRWRDRCVAVIPTCNGTMKFESDPNLGRRVIFAVFPGCEILDLACPVQAFHEASALGSRYVMSYHASTTSVRTAQGLELGSLHPLPDVEPGDRVI